MPGVLHTRIDVDFYFYACLFCKLSESSTVIQKQFLIPNLKIDRGQAFEVCIQRTYIWIFCVAFFSENHCRYAENCFASEKVVIAVIGYCRPTHYFQVKPSGKRHSCCGHRKTFFASKK